MSIPWERDDDNNNIQAKYHHYRAHKKLNLFSISCKHSKINYMYIKQLAFVNKYTGVFTSLHKYRDIILPCLFRKAIEWGCTATVVNVTK